MERVTENVFAATDIRGCDPGYVVTSEGVVAVDTPQLPTKAVAMREEMARRGPLRYLINTEHHIDHIFGNYYFAGLCPVIGHEEIVKVFWTPIHGVAPYPYMVDVVKKDDPGGMKLMPGPEMKVDPPTITFSRRLTFKLGRHTFELIHTPGHTRGQIAVYVPEEKVVFVGDTIFCECQTWFHSADPDSWLQTLALLYRLDVEYIVPGHGPICGKDYILKQSAIIREWIAAVAIGMAKGWSKAECVERISFLDRWPVDIGQESTGPMIQVWNVEKLYDYLLGKAERF